MAWDDESLPSVSLSTAIGFSLRGQPLIRVSLRERNPPSGTMEIQTSKDMDMGGGISSANVGGSQSAWGGGP